MQGQETVRDVGPEAGLGDLGERPGHFLAGLEVELGRRPHARLVDRVQVDVHLDAHQGILGIGIGRSGRNIGTHIAGQTGEKLKSC